MKRLKNSTKLGVHLLNESSLNETKDEFLIIG